MKRSFSWFNWYRRLGKDYEVLPQTHETFVQVATPMVIAQKACLIEKFNTSQTSSNENLKNLDRITKKSGLFV